MIDFAFNDAASTRTGYSAFTSVSRAAKKKQRRMPKLDTLGLMSSECVSEVQSEYDTNYEVEEEEEKSDIEIIRERQPDPMSDALADMDPNELMFATPRDISRRLGLGKSQSIKHLNEEMEAAKTRSTKSDKQKTAADIDRKVDREIEDMKMGRLEQRIHDRHDSRGDRDSQELSDDDNESFKSFNSSSASSDSIKLNTNAYNKPKYDAKSTSSRRSSRNSYEGTNSVSSHGSSSKPSRKSFDDLDEKIKSFQQLGRERSSSRSRLQLTDKIIEKLEEETENDSPDDDQSISRWLKDVDKKTSSKTKHKDQAKSLVKEYAKSTLAKDGTLNDTADPTVGSSSGYKYRTRRAPSLSRDSDDPATPKDRPKNLKNLKNKYLDDDHDEEDDKFDPTQLSRKFKSKYLDDDEDDRRSNSSRTSKSSRSKPKPYKSHKKYSIDDDDDLALCNSSVITDYRIRSSP